MKAGYIYILLTILLTSYGQLVLKWRMVKYPTMPESFYEKISCFVRLVMDRHYFQKRLNRAEIIVIYKKLSV